MRYEGSANLMYEQLNEFMKFLKDEPNKMATSEYGHEIISVLNMILND